MHQEQTFHDPEKMWDSRAKEYSQAQKESGWENPTRLTELLHQKDLLTQNTVLDVGGGAGRYAIPFSFYAKRVVVTDISAQMLLEAESNAKLINASNLEYAKADWGTVDLPAIGWEHQFDLVFSSMCAAATTKEGLEKLCLVSKGWVLINRIIRMQDSLATHLVNNLAKQPIHDPHNDREIFATLFKQVWDLNYNPETFYFMESQNRTISLEQAYEWYAPRFLGQAEESGISLESLFESYAGTSKGQVKIEQTMAHALLLWKVEENN